MLCRDLMQQLLKRNQEDLYYWTEEDDENVETVLKHIHTVNSYHTVEDLLELVYGRVVSETDIENFITEGMIAASKHGYFNR